MKFARYTYATAGILGLVALLPMYFFLERTGIDNPPPVTHPEFYYGFIGVAVAFQIVFLVIATDPLKYKLLIPATIVEKFSFVIPTLYLYSQGRAAGMMVAGACMDLVLGILFVVCFFKLRGENEEIELASELEN